MGTENQQPNNPDAGSESSSTTVSNALNRNIKDMLKKQNLACELKTLKQLRRPTAAEQESWQMTFSYLSCHQVRLTVLFPLKKPLNTFKESQNNYLLMRLKQTILGWKQQRPVYDMQETNVDMTLDLAKEKLPADFQRPLSIAIVSPEAVGKVSGYTKLAINTAIVATLASMFQLGIGAAVASGAALPKTALACIMGGIAAVTLAIILISLYCNYRIQHRLTKNPTEHAANIPFWQEVPNANAGEASTAHLIQRLPTRP